MSSKNRYGYMEGVAGIVINLLLFGLKYWAGVVTGSLALIADAWHTLSDSASSIIVLGSVKLSSRRPDREHPFGHGRYQQIASIFMTFLLGVIAYEYLVGSVEKLISRESTDFGTLAIVVTALSVVMKEGLAQYAFWAYRKSGLESLKADGWHHRSDALSSLVILAGILLGNRFWWMDAVLAFLVSLLLVYAVYEILRSAVNKLLGERPDAELVDRIRKLVSRISDSEIHPHHFHLHTYGDHRELTFHIKLDGRMDIYSGHQIAQKIEEALRDEMKIEATIHLEPLDRS